MNVELTKEAEKLLAGYPSDYRDKAIAAVQRGKAFCPSCYSVGYSNCGHFDECNAFVMPDGSRAT